MLVCHTAAFMMRLFSFSFLSLKFYFIGRVARAKGAYEGRDGK